MHRPAEPTRPSPTPRAAAAPRGRVRLFLHELRALTVLSGPIVISQLGQVGMHTADTIMVGPLGAVPLAATGIGTAIYQVMMTTSIGVVMGMAPLVSQAFGAGDRPRCRAVLVQGVWLALAMSVPIMLICRGGTTLARLLGQDPSVAALAGGYLDALVWSVPPMILFFAVRQFLEGMSIATPATVVTLLGLAVNIGANRVLIYGVPAWGVPAMGVVGSGWATTIVRWTMLAAIGLYLLRHADLHPFRGVSWRPARAGLARIVRIGIPVGSHIGLEVGIFALAAVVMGWLGPVQLAAHQVTINLATTTFMVALGASLAGSIRVGQHVGARRPRAAGRAAAAAYTLAVGFMALCAVVFLVMPETLVGLYTPDPEIARLGVQLLFLAALFQIFDGAQVAGASVLRGMADTTVPMLVAAVGYWIIGLPSGYALAFGADMGAVGIWVGLSIGLAAVAITLAGRVRRKLAELASGVAQRAAAPGPVTV